MVAHLAAKRAQQRDWRRGNSKVERMAVAMVKKLEGRGAAWRAEQMASSWADGWAAASAGRWAELTVAWSGDPWVVRKAARLAQKQAGRTAAVMAEKTVDR